MNRICRTLQARMLNQAAKAVISSGFAPVETELDAAELAAWTGVARVILNLHETITRY